MIEINTIKDAVEFAAIKRVLVIKLQHLGDVLLTTPVFSKLKEQYPHLEIDVLIYQETKVVLEANPCVHEIHTIDRTWKIQGKLHQLRHEINLGKRLQARQYDLIINLTDRWRGAWLTRFLRPSYSVSQPYPHRRGKFWRKSFTHIYRVPRQNRHTVEKNLDAIRRLGVQINSSDKTLTFVSNSSATDKIRDMLGGDRFGEKKIIVIHPTSRWMFKAWHPQGFAKVIDHLYELGHRPVLISGPATMEIEYAQMIMKQVSSPVIDLSGRLSLQECGALIELADCFLGLDSVAMHIASAVNTPCVALFGPTIDKVWGPWMVRHKIITEQVNCRPCQLKGCGDGMVSECLQMIKPETVIESVVSMLNHD